MRKVADGNLDLLKVLFDRHHRHVYNYLFKMSGDAMLSEDLTQDVFYKLIKYRSSYKDGAFVSWLFSIARNNLKTHFTRNHKYHEPVDVLAYKAVANDALKAEENVVTQGSRHGQAPLGATTWGTEVANPSTDVLAWERFNNVHRCRPRLPFGADNLSILAEGGCLRLHMRRRSL